MNQTFEFSVNGQPRSVTTDPERPLRDVLREDLQILGPKCGCGEGECGACSVLINGKAVVSCITPVANVHGQTIVTIEGLTTNGQLHPVQEAFLAEAGFQCGYCTSGMIIAVVGLLNEKPNPTEPEIQARLAGHLCRCCSYVNILKAIRSAVAQSKK